MRLSLIVLSVASLALGPVALTSTEGAAAPPQSGLVLQYSLATLTGGVVVDSSPSALHGRVVAASGTARLAPGPPGYGQAVQLSGASHQFVDVPRSPLLDLDTFTLSAWVRYTGVPNDATGGRWEVLEKPDSYWINVRTTGRVRAGGFFGGCTSAAWRYLDSTVTLPRNTWRHVAATYDGAWLRIFVDARPAGALRVSGRTCVTSEPLAIGAKNNPSKGLLEAFWDGRLDELRLYRRALSTTEIGQLAARS